jgi:hypothetical protein
MQVAGAMVVTRRKDYLLIVRAVREIAIMSGEVLF